MSARGLLVALALAAAPVPAGAQTAAPVDTAVGADETGADRFRVLGDRLYFDTEGENSGASGIEPGDAEALARVLRDNPGVAVVDLNSSGGDYFEGFLIADVLADFQVASHVSGSCDSSCAHAFLGGSRRTIDRGARLGFHRSTWGPEAAADYYRDLRDEESWQTPFDMISWLYEDTQAEVYERLVFITDRGVDPRFAIETLRSASDRMWYPSRARLLAARYLTE